MSPKVQQHWSMNGIGGTPTSGDIIPTFHVHRQFFSSVTQWPFQEDDLLNTFEWVNLKLGRGGGVGGGRQGPNSEIIFIRKGNKNIGEVEVRVGVSREIETVCREIFSITRVINLPPLPPPSLQPKAALLSSPRNLPIILNSEGISIDYCLSPLPCCQAQKNCLR